MTSFFPAPHIRVPIIVGPTGVGKTQFSLRLAEKIELEIISADSRQIYRYMDIGTAKPTATQRNAVVHHFIDIKFPDEYYSAGSFSREARTAIDEISRRGKLPVVVGGAGFYIRALVDGFFEAEIRSDEVKRKLQTAVKLTGLEPFYEKLKQVDPLSAQRIHHNDRQRILRALEVWEIAGIPLSQFHQEEIISADFQAIYIGLNMDRQSLYDKIERRVDEMIRNGLIDEVKRLMQMGYSEQLPSLQTVGYKETFDYLKGRISHVQMIELIKQNSRNYAKRQLTWFKRMRNIHWIDIDDNPDPLSIFETILN